MYDSYLKFTHQPESQFKTYKGQIPFVPVLMSTTLIIKNKTFFKIKLIIMDESRYVCLGMFDMLERGDRDD